MQISHSSQNGTAVQVQAIIASETDEALIESIAAGNKLAMRTLFARHHVRVYRFALRFTRDESRAEDVVSEVFLDTWRHAASFQGRCRVATWLLAIARNKAIEAGRQRKFAALDETQAEAMEDPSDTPERALDKKDHGILLQRCLQALSPIHRQIIDLVYYQSKSVQEAAKIVGIPLSTVKTRMFYARNQLGELLKDAGIQKAFA
jgi:RNA polymerase sigma-70 factor, ECF subfamily